MLSAEHRPQQFRPISPVRKTQLLKMGENTQTSDVVSHTTSPDHYEHIFLVTGPAGCGKTTVAQYLAKQLNAPYVEGDDVSSKGDVIARLT